MVLPLAQATTPLPFLSPALGSHMVMQRGKANAFWGWTTPGETVTVSVGGQAASGVAGSDGRWLVRVAPPKVGGPYVVEIDGSQHLQLDDVLVGDVWLCTGQSNMEFGLTLEKGGAEETAAATDPNLRLFIAPHQASLLPQKTNGGAWKVCSPMTVAQEGWGGFSAVGYHFGKAIRREVGVPIGLVEDCWGGTNAESWASREGIRPLKDFDAVFPRIDEMRTSPQPSVTNDPGVSGSWQAGELDVSGWKTVGVLSAFHDLGMDLADGTVWLRKEVALTESQAAGGATLSLGTIDDNDVTWINGTQVGATQGYNVPRNYAVPAGLLHAGRNVVVVRAEDTGSFGGLSGPADALSLTLADGSKLALAGDWLAKAGMVTFAADPNIPTVLSNGMIDPELPLAIKGAIWYQGENNAGRAFQYRRVLPAMIGDWRRRFGQGDFPFYIVSLANFTAHKDVPGDDEWAELREAQAMTARGVRNGGLALAIDVGDAADIHPTDKKTVGERLALVALAKDYGKSVAYQGPTYRSMTVVGSSIRLRFDHAQGLNAHGGAPGEFAVAGADHKWHVATAQIDGDAVVVSATDVPQPVAVRYAWQSNPVANLYNSAGLPAVPFRTDDWPGITVGRK